MFLGKKRILGLDIGTSTVKLAYVGFDKNGPELLGVGRASVTPGAVTEAGVVEPELVAGSIREAIDKARVPRSVRCVVAGVPAKQLSVRTVSLTSRLGPEEIPEAAKWEVAEFLPYPVEEAVLDFSALDNLTGTGQMDVLCVATRNSVVEGLVRAVELAGLEPVALDAVPAALGRVLLKAHDPNDQQREAVALVDIGAVNTEVSVFVGGDLRVSRAVHLAGHSFTEAIANALGLRPDEAERIQRTQAEVREVADPQTREDVIASCCNQVAEELAHELQRSFDYFRAQNQWMPIGSVILTGEGSRLKGLASYVSETIGLPVASGDPIAAGLVRVNAPAESLAGLSAVSLGLALWEVSEA